MVIPSRQPSYILVLIFKVWKWMMVWFLPSWNKALPLLVVVLSLTLCLCLTGAYTCAVSYGIVWYLLATRGYWALEIWLFWIGMCHNSETHTGGNSLAAQWLGLRTFTAQSLGSIPCLETKIPQASWHWQINKKQSKIHKTHSEFQIVLNNSNKKKPTHECRISQ